MQPADTIALIGLFVAVFAVMVVPFAIYFDSVNKRLQATQQELGRSVRQVQIQTQMLGEAAQSMSELATAISARQSFFSGMLEALLEADSATSSQLEAFRRSNFRFEESIGGALNDILLFSSNERDRLSAFRKAADSMGTLVSLRKMKLCAELHPDWAKECLSCVRSLEHRLEQRPSSPIGR